MALASRQPAYSAVEAARPKPTFWESILYWPLGRKITAAERLQMSENERAIIIFKESWLWIVAGLLAFLIMAWVGVEFGTLPTAPAHVLPR
jgi:hypothetical protein